MSESAVTPVQTSNITAAPAAKKGWILWVALIGYVALQIWLGGRVTPSMERVTGHPHNLEQIFGWTIPFGGVNEKILINTWFVMAIMVVLALFGRFGLKRFPGRRQGIFEVIITTFDGLCQESLGPRLGRSVVPYITTLFFFIMLANWLMLLYVLPWVEEPTLNLNTTLALGTVAFFVSHGIAIKEKGFIHYLSHYFEPFIEVGKFKIPNIFFCPLHLIGEIGKVVSHSFRLFGNILGGAIIYVVVTALIKHMVLPPFLHLFFGIFVGVIQAFVFTLLALTYISILASHDGEEEGHAHG